MLELNSPTKNRLELYTFLLIVGITFSVFIIRQKYRDDRLNSKHKYTIGFLKEFDMPADCGEMGIVYYYLNGVTYRESFTLTDDKSNFKLGSRFFHKILS